MSHELVRALRTIYDDIDSAESGLPSRALSGEVWRCLQPHGQALFITALGTAARTLIFPQVGSGAVDRCIKAIEATRKLLGQNARCTDERLYLSMYWHSAGDANDPDGKTAAEANLSRSNRSLIVKIDPSKSTRPLACYKLTGYLATSHVAGLGKRGDDLYVIATDGGSYIERYKIPDAETTTTCVDIAPTGRWPVVTGGSLSIVGDAVLVTDYASSSQADTPYLYVYRLDASGAVSTDYKTKYLLPRIAEGVAYYDPTNNSTPFAPDDDAQLLVAQVSGIVRRYSARTLKNKAGSGDPTLPATTAPSLLVPRGVQDMTFNGTQIWMASESGSKFIQRSQAKGWPELFPFVFSASPSPSGWR